MSCML